MLYREIMAVCSEIHTKHINTLCGQNVELLNVKLVVHIVTTVRYIQWPVDYRGWIVQRNAIPTRSCVLPVHMSQCMSDLRDVRFSQRCCWRFKTSGMWRSVTGRLVTDLGKCSTSRCRTPYVSSLVRLTSHRVRRWSSHSRHVRCGCNVKYKRRWCHIDHVPNLGWPKWGQVKGEVI